MVRRGSFLAPLTPADAEAVELLPAAKEMAVRVSLGARSVPGLRFYWAMLASSATTSTSPFGPRRFTNGSSSSADTPNRSS